MTTAQTPIGSGFGAATTAREVLDGIDLTGRLAVVTGGYSGLGLEATRALTAAGAHVVVPARRPDAAKEALDGIEGVELATLDLGDLDSVAAFARDFLDSGRAIDMMIDNAGIMATPETRVGPGWEAQFATNHLGHFALVNRLWPAIERGRDARVVSVSSRGHHRSPVRFDDLDWRAEPYDKWAAYGQSKTANVLFAVQLDALAADRGVRAFSLHPGGIMTPLQRHLPARGDGRARVARRERRPDPRGGRGIQDPRGRGGHRGLGGDVAPARRPGRALPRGLRGRRSSPTNPAPTASATTPSTPRPRPASGPSRPSGRAWTRSPDGSWRAHPCPGGRAHDVHRRCDGRGRRVGSTGAITRPAQEGHPAVALRRRDAPESAVNGDSSVRRACPERASRRRIVDVVDTSIVGRREGV